MPNRLLSYLKIVKIESKKISLLNFFAETHPFLSKNTECFHSAPTCLISFS